MFLSEYVANGVENVLPFFGEPAQDQHRLRGERVDNGPKIFVIQKQINELSEVDVIDSDGWGALR